MLLGHTLASHFQVKLSVTDLRITRIMHNCGEERREVIDMVLGRKNYQQETRPTFLRQHGVFSLQKDDAWQKDRIRSYNHSCLTQLILR